MKTLKPILLFVFFLSFNTYAQYNNYNQYRNQNNYPSQSSSKPSPEDIEKIRIERIEKYMDKLNRELILDELQYIAIKNEIVANSKRIDIILKKEKSEDEQAKEIEYQVKKLESDINSFLNENQKEKYKLLNMDIKSKKSK